MSKINICYLVWMLLIGYKPPPRYVPLSKVPTFSPPQQLRNIRVLDRRLSGRILAGSPPFPPVRPFITEPLAGESPASCLLLEGFQRAEPRTWPVRPATPSVLRGSTTNG